MRVYEDKLMEKLILVIFDKIIELLWLGLK